LSDIDVVLVRAHRKVDERGQLVDIRTLSKARLSSLIDFYEVLSKRARSVSMKDLYAGIHEDLTKFRNSGLVPREDALSFARSMGIENVRYFMDTYWHGEPFPKDSGTENRQFFQNILDRNTKYERPAPLSDEAVRQLYRAADEHQNINQILRELAGDYGVRLPTIVELEHDLEPEGSLATYDPAAKTIIVNAHLKADTINVLFIIGSCFFQHLSNLRGWRFADTILAHLELERKEADAFAESILDRLVQLGYFAKRRKGD
jgi:hypothetical protein